MGDRPVVGVCLKWVERRPEVDPLTGEVAEDGRSSGASEADLSALEWALRLGAAWGATVVAVTAGPAAAEPVLREALAAGADRALRVDLPATAASTAVAAGLAGVLVGAEAVVCGDWSLDRGSGSVPAFLAAHLGAAQALGLVAVTIDSDADPDSGADSGADHDADAGAAFDRVPARRVRAERRLDGGRRERLEVTAPMVLSVEGRERLRRADLDDLLRARGATVEVVVPLADGPSAGPHEPAPVASGPYRPRPRVLPPPAGGSARERILALTGALADRTPPEQVVLEPGPAADRLLAQLRAWGYLD